MSNNRINSETTITIYGDKLGCYVMTNDSEYIEFLDKLCEEAPEEYKIENVGVIDGVVTDKEYIISDKALIRFFRK